MITDYTFVSLRDNIGLTFRVVDLLNKNKDSFFTDLHNVSKKGIFADVFSEVRRNPQFLACLNNDGDFLGCFKLDNWVSGNGFYFSCDAHIVFDRAFRKDSVAASRQLADYIFNTIGVHKITAPILETNLVAQNFVKKVGFKLESINREATIKNGNLTDIYNYTLFKKDFNNG